MSGSVSNNRKAISDAGNDIAEQAAEWLLALEDGDAQAQARTRRDFDAWQRADPRHATAANKARSFLESLDQLTAPGPARKALEARFHQRSRTRKRLAGGSLAILLFFTLPALLLLHQYPLDHLGADLQANAGEWHSETLADGSKVTLGGKSAVDIRFTPQLREVHLLAGEIHVDVAKEAGRPFVVSTEYGQIRALGTRFIVNHEHERVTRLSMLESRVRVSADTTSKPVELGAGEQVRLDGNGIGPVTRFNASQQEKSWQQRQLVVHGWPLAQVLAELARYHQGYLHYDVESLPVIRISAVLPLDKPDEALQLLASSFPAIRVRQITPWLAMVSAAK
ncbi:MAG: FecR family protein [Alcanivorax sp.]|uniref:FecR family protein n=1 Tax=Alcanivorax sp. TaxID=1872427 RepID=UPI003DA6D24A